MPAGYVVWVVNVPFPTLIWFGLGIPKRIETLLPLTPAPFVAVEGAPLLAIGEIGYAVRVKVTGGHKRGRIPDHVWRPYRLLERAVAVGRAGSEPRLHCRTVDCSVTRRST